MAPTEQPAPSSTVQSEASAGTPNDPLPHRGRVAVITGASSGIGAALTKRLVHGGAQVFVSARRLDRLEKLAAELESAPGELAYLTGDAANPDFVGQLMDAARDRFGRDACLVVANAGKGLSGSLVTGETSTWQELIEINVLGLFHLLRQAGQRMIAAVQQRPQQPYDIIALGSVVGMHVVNRNTVYVASKHAVHAAAESMRREIGPLGIRVTLIEPGAVGTEFFEVAGITADRFENIIAPFQPILQPDDIARAIEFTITQPWHVHIDQIRIRPVRQDYP